LGGGKRMLRVAWSNLILGNRKEGGDGWKVSGSKMLETMVKIA